MQQHNYASRMSGQWLAVGAGFSAALASVSAKLAMSPEIVLHLCHQMLDGDSNEHIDGTASSHACDPVSNKIVSPSYNTLHVLYEFVDVTFHLIFYKKNVASKAF